MIGPRTACVLALCACAALGATACRRSRGAPAPPGPGSPATVARPGSGDPPAAPRPDDVDLVEALPRCDVAHRGMLLDVGTPPSQALVGPWNLGPAVGPGDAEHDGATFARMWTRRFVARFYLDEPSPLFIAVRARGGTARSLSAFLDTKPMGTVALARGVVRTGATRATAAPVPAGAHALALKAVGGGRPASEPYAEIDWARLGVPDDDPSAYAPPTVQDIVGDTRLGGVPHRSIGLRAPAWVRCFVPVGPATRVRAAVGLAGGGEADAEIRVLRDGVATATIAAPHVVGGDQAAWTSVDTPLGGGAGIAAVELRAVRATRGGRVAFGDPSLVEEAPPPLAPAPRARVAVVVLLSGLDLGRVGPPARGLSLPALDDLAASSVVFRRHRAPTTVAAGVVASVLTGLPPHRHGLVDPAARLPPSLATVATAARDGGVQAAMTTGCPTTFAAFGFARDWETFRAFSPVEGAPATAPIDEAARWLAVRAKEPGSRAIAVVHARGGHPPWDVTPAQAHALPPPEYGGTMDPRRAGEILARARPRKARFRLGEADRTRMWAIYDQALAGQDRALLSLVEALRKAGVWDRTLLVVGGDVGVDPTARAPFGDAEPLGETMLAVPLVVHFPDGALAGTTVVAPTTATDIPRTVLEALGLAVPDGFEGTSLWAVATRGARAVPRPLLATLGGTYAMRWADLVLHGVAGAPPGLCDFAADAACATDRRDASPIGVEALWRRTHDALASGAGRPSAAREPATIDPDTAAALQVWGP